LHLLICTDGTPSSAPATTFGTFLAASLRADVTVLQAPAGHPWEQLAARAAAAVRDDLTEVGLECQVISRSEFPRRAIVAQSTESTYDILIVGLLGRGSWLRRWLRGPSTRRVLQQVAMPVLVVPADRTVIGRILVCSGDLWYPAETIELVGQIARAFRSEVTLLYVVPKPPLDYPILHEIENNWGALLQMDNPQARNLKAGREALRRHGIETLVSLRHGPVIGQILDEIHTGEYDLVALGSTYAAQSLHRYFDASVTDRVVEHANRPVLVARHKQTSRIG
jgi:nucleotide-binding universal stress UspA family protein